MKSVGIQNVVKNSALLVSMMFGMTVYAENSMVTIESKYSVAKTADNFENVIKAKGLTLFNRIDHAKNARGVGMHIRPSQVIIFGNPKLGTKLMQCEQAIAIDLPLKVHVWADNMGKVRLSYLNPESLKQRHNVKGCDTFFNKMSKVLPALSKKAVS